VAIFAPRIDRVLETALYVDDPRKAARFYRELFGLEPMFGDDRLVALDCGPKSVLLLFARGKTSEPVVSPSGVIPGHEGAGRLHLALAVRAEDLPAFETRLSERGVAIEGRMDWPRGGRSIYFRDMDDNLVELATAGLWPNY
jgi:catechol 2,3-dioxygenase-like lactoylglutathione lyase family enzyme